MAQGDWEQCYACRGLIRDTGGGVEACELCGQVPGESRIEDDALLLGDFCMKNFCLSCKSPVS